MRKLSFVFLVLAFFTSCNNRDVPIFESQLPTDNERIWIGPEYWANPLQDWQLKNGQIECITSGGFRSIYLLTRELGSQEGDFQMEVKIENLNAKDTLSEGWIGFEIGIKGEFDDYRDNAVRGRGFPLGITSSDQLFIGKLDDAQKENPLILNEAFKLKLIGELQKDGLYTLKLQLMSQNEEFSMIRSDIPSFWIEGGIALMCHSGELKEFPDKIELDEYPVWGTAKGTHRNGNISFGFKDWKLLGSKLNVLDQQVFGPILFCQYTLGKNILKLTAQMPPIGSKDAQEVALQLKDGENWKTIATEKIDPFARTATFKITNWKSDKDIPYRIAYQLYSAGNQLSDYYYEGLIRKEPFDKDNIVVAGFTGNNDLGFPNPDIFSSVEYHNPDLLFFSGDQIYEGVGGFGAQRSPIEKAYIDYLRKWYLYGWAYGDLLRNRPSIAIPDDHDVYHGNIWGAGGIATPEGTWGATAQDAGGYKMPANWVNMVQRTQTAHLPDAFDPRPVEQGIDVYYTDLQYAGISFAILEDRKFKSAPKSMLKDAEIINGWAQNTNFNAAKESDVSQAVLLGDRQLEFLENWGQDWNNTWMKVVLSQTIFANVATLPIKNSHTDAHVPKLKIFKAGEYPDDDVPVSDFDSNGWPQTGRNNALKSMQKSFAFHIAGDQHLGSFIKYGVDNYQDAGYAFCVPSISNVWPRRWFPAERSENWNPNEPKYTGDYHDGFGNKMTVLAVSNPIYTGKKPEKLYDRATGYGIIKFNRKSRDITVECWPRQANPKVDSQYDGWPITINQLDNFMSNATYYLPKLSINGMEDPVIQIIDETTKEIIYTLRIKGTSFQPKVMKAGNYTLKIGELGTKNEQQLEHLGTSKKSKEELIITFK